MSGLTAVTAVILRSREAASRRMLQALVPNPSRLAEEGEHLRMTPELLRGEAVARAVSARINPDKYTPSPPAT